MNTIIHAFFNNNNTWYVNAQDMQAIMINFYFPSLCDFTHNTNEEKIGACKQAEASHTVAVLPTGKNIITAKPINANIIF